MLIFQQQITSDDLTNNPRVLYLFGDNYTRRGLGGQAKVMRPHGNAHGIATKWLPTTEPHAFFSDDDFDTISEILSVDFHRPRSVIRQGGVVVCPAAGLGTGLSQLPKRAPKVMDLVRTHITTLMSISKGDHS